MNQRVGRVLVVDDNELSRELLVRRLRRVGHHVEEAAGGREALAMIDSRPYDLVLLDVMLPDVSDWEVLRRVRERFTLAELPVIMVTARDQSDDIAQALSLGANDYVTKPVDWKVVRARAATQLELRRLSRLKDEFMRMASHDLKNPLQCILGVAELMAEECAAGKPLDSATYRDIAGLSESAHLMLGIIRDFLDLEAMEAGNLRLHRELLELNASVRNAVERGCGHARGKDISLSVDLDPRIPRSAGDKHRIDQVLDNLVSNALKFTPVGGAVIVRTRFDAEQVLFEIEDTGPGMTDEDFSRLFVRYARLGARPTGGEESSGLGLSIAKELVEAHGGSIGARNNPERGATFWFRLPCVAAGELL